MSVNGIVLRCRIVIVSCTSASRPCSSDTLDSMSRTICSASSSRPWMKSHRGLSGTVRRTMRIPTARIAPRPKAPRQPISGLTIDRKSTRLNSSHANISYAVFCLKKTTELQSRQYLVCRLLLDKNIRQQSTLLHTHKESLHPHTTSPLLLNLHHA